MQSEIQHGITLTTGLDQRLNLAEYTGLMIPLRGARRCKT